MAVYKIYVKLFEPIRFVERAGLVAQINGVLYTHFMLDNGESPFYKLTDDSYKDYRLEFTLECFHKKDWYRVIADYVAFVGYRYSNAGQSLVEG